MKLWFLFPRLLSILAVLSLLTALMAAPSAAAMIAAAPMAAMEDMAGMAEDMPCCPQQRQSLPDCQKSCPSATLCVAKCFPNAPAVSASHRAIFVPVTVLTLWDDAARDLLAEPPPPRPPRT